MKLSPRNLIKQYRKPLPKWAKWTRNIGLGLAVVAGNIVSGGALFPATVVTIAGYVAWGGTTVAAVAQAFSE